MKSHCVAQAVLEAIILPLSLASAELTGGCHQTDWCEEFYLFLCWIKGLILPRLASNCLPASPFWVPAIIHLPPPDLVFCDTGDLALGFVHASRAFCQLNYSPNPHLFFETGSCFGSYLLFVKFCLKREEDDYWARVAMEELLVSKL